jgi:hypothetical protein
MTSLSGSAHALIMLARARAYIAKDPRGKERDRTVVVPSAVSEEHS